jgi:GAF domain-containing protein
MTDLYPSSQLPGAQDRAAIGWRERFLLLVLRGASVLGLLALTLLVLSAANPEAKLIAGLMYGTLLLATTATRIPYPIRAGVLLVLLYFAALALLFDYGVAEASILFIGLVVMTGLLLPARNAIYCALGISTFSLLIFGAPGAAFMEWARPVAILIVVSLFTAIGLRKALDEFAETRETAQATLETLWTERASFEQRVEERTAGLARKAQQLRATSYIARKTAEVQDLASLLELVTRLVSDEFGFYHTGIFLINETGDRAILQAASSEGGRQMVEMGHTLSVGSQGIVGYVAAQKKPRIALDVGVEADAVFFNNPYLPMTRSELALPLLVRNKALGVLDIQSDKPQAFSSEDIDILQTLADQLAVAIENARLVDETQSAMIQLEALTSLRTHEAWSKKLEEGNRVFTYTPLGIRAEKLPQDESRAASAPIMLRGQKIGTIALARKGEVTWTEADKNLVEEVANQVGLAIDNIRLLEEATQRAMQEQAVGRLASRFSQSLDLDTLLQTAARELGQLPDVAEVSVLIGQPGESGAQPKQPFRHKIS